MLELINVNDCPGVSVPFLYRLLLERPQESWISHRGMVTMENHSDFCRRHPYSVWYLITQGTYNPEGVGWALGTLLGSIYLTKQNEIGIFIAKEHQRKGYAKLAIAELKKLQPRPFYLGNVAPNNEPSHELFKALGGKLVQHTYRFT